VTAISWPEVSLSTTTGVVDHAVGAAAVVPDAAPDDGWSAAPEGADDEPRSWAPVRAAGSSPSKPQAAAARTQNMPAARRTRV